MSDLDELLKQMADPSELAWNEETYDLATARASRMRTERRTWRS